MELEKRVKTLEYEVKILKNELQRTLLDIEEQILLHYYPSLRADSSVPSEGAVQTFKSIQREKGKVVDTSLLPKTKRVSLEQAKAVRGPGHPPGEELPSSPPGQQADQATILELSQWLSKSVGQIGQARTVKLIELSADRGTLSADAQEILVRMAAFDNGDNPVEEVSTSEMLDRLLKLDQLLGCDTDLAEALALIEEADLG